MRESSYFAQLLWFHWPYLLSLLHRPINDKERQVISYGLNSKSSHPVESYQDNIFKLNILSLILCLTNMSFPSMWSFSFALSTISIPYLINRLYLLVVENLGSNMIWVFFTRIKLINSLNYLFTRKSNRCCWVYSVKYLPKGYINCLKAHKPVELIILRHFLVVPIFLSQQKYVVNLVSRTGFLSAQPIDIQMHSTLNLMKDKESSSHSCWKNNLSH